MEERLREKGWKAERCAHGRGFSGFRISKWEKQGEFRTIKKRLHYGRCHEKILFFEMPGKSAFFRNIRPQSEQFFYLGKNFFGNSYQRLP